MSERSGVIRVWLKPAAIKQGADGACTVGPFPFDCVFMGFQVGPGVREPIPSWWTADALSCLNQHGLPLSLFAMTVSCKKNEDPAKELRDSHRGRALRMEEYRRVRMKVRLDTVTNRDHGEEGI